MYAFMSQSRHRRRGFRQGALVPVGGTAGFYGTVASIPTGWALCDGTNGTRDLEDTFVPGEDITYSGAGGAAEGVLVSGSTNSAGSHTGGNVYQAGNATGSYCVPDAAGTHNHTGVLVEANSIAYDPPHYKLAYMQKITEPGPMPANAICWRDGNTVDGDYVTFGDLQDRFMKGQVGDSRVAGGADTISIDLHIWGGPAHHHGLRLDHDPGAGGAKMQNMPGSHDHSTVFTPATTKPPYIGLLAMRANIETGIIENLIMAFNGNLGDLTGSGWHECDGSNGTRDCRGRIPIGIGGSFSLGDTGGDFNNESGSDTTATNEVVHGHYQVALPTMENGYVNHHNNYSWPHTHTASWEVTKTLLWNGMPYIQYTGA